MTYLYQLFIAFMTGLLLTGVGYAHKIVRPAWVTQAQPVQLPARWVKQPPVRAWKLVMFPAVKTVQFPQGAVPNRAVQNIPAQTVLEHRITAAPVYVPHLRGYIFPGKSQIDAVIFDLDGTLLDSLSAWEHSGSNFVRSQGIEPESGLDDELVTMSLLDGAKLIKARYQLDYTPEEILAKTLQPINAHYYTDIQPMPGVVQLLARLQTQGVKMAVATAGDKKLAEAALARLGLLHYFEFIITCDEVGVGKSSPAIYEEALKRLGTAKSRTLVAEDALHALQTAYTAGFPTAAIEEIHSASQRAEKQQVATYYIMSY